MLKPSSELSWLQRGIRDSLARRLVSQGMLGLSSLLDELSFTGRKRTCGDFPHALCRWGLMNVVMVMMIIIQILPHPCALGRPELPLLSD